MKNKPVMTKERIIIGIAGILILAVGAFYRFSPEFPVSSIQDKVDRISKYQAKSALLPVLEERLPTLVAATEKSFGRLLSEPSDELAGVAVQNIIRNAVSLQDISLISITTRKPDLQTYQYVSVIPVQIAFKAEIRQLKNLIYHIETHNTLLSIPEFRIIKPASGSGDDLNIIMTVQGFLKKQN